MRSLSARDQLFVACRMRWFLDPLTILVTAARALGHGFDAVRVTSFINP